MKPRSRSFIYALSFFYDFDNVTNSLFFSSFDLVALDSLYLLVWLGFFFVYFCPHTVWSDIMWIVNREIYGTLLLRTWPILCRHSKWFCTHRKKKQKLFYIKLLSTYSENVLQTVGRALSKAIAVGQRLNNRSFTSAMVYCMYFLFQFTTFQNRLEWEFNRRKQKRERERERSLATVLSSY